MPCFLTSSRPPRGKRQADSKPKQQLRQLLLLHSHFPGLLLRSHIFLYRTKNEDQIIWKLSGEGDEFCLADYEKSPCQHYVTVDGNRYTVFDNGNRNGLTRVVTWQVDTDAKAVEAVDIHAFNGKFSKACGSAQRVDGGLYVISFGAATKDNEYMAVMGFTTGEKLLSITLDNPQDFTYRCVYYE